MREFEIKRTIEVIPNFVNSYIYKRSDVPCLREKWAPNGEPKLMHLSNIRPVKANHRCGGTQRWCARKFPAKLVMIGEGP